MNFEIDPRAAADAQQARMWYRERSVGVARAFIAELDRIIDQIRSLPLAGSPRRPRTRHMLLRRFPYSVIYTVVEDRIRVIAVAHHKRRPSFWRKRLQS
jgi:plasmid stabilization system protein ParE